MKDPVRPSHYHPKDGSGIHCHHAQRAALGAQGFEDYMIGCAMKYLYRWRHKNGAEDLAKAGECVRIALESVLQDNPTLPKQDQPSEAAHPSQTD